MTETQVNQRHKSYDKIKRGKRLAELKSRLATYETKAEKASQSSIENIANGQIAEARLNAIRALFWRFLADTARDKIKIAQQELDSAVAIGTRVGRGVAWTIAVAIAAIVASFVVYFRIFDVGTFDKMMVADFGPLVGNVFVVVAITFFFVLICVGGFNIVFKLFLSEAGKAGGRVAQRIHEEQRVLDDVSHMPTDAPDLPTDDNTQSSSAPPSNTQEST